MTIDQILKEKGAGVTTVTDTQTLHSVAKVLDEARIGAVVAIGTDGKVTGVLSERDIVRQLARHGAGAMTMTVAAAMTRDVITATPQETVDHCMELMTDRRIRHLPILKDGGLAGLISIGDLVKWKIAATEAEAEAMKSYIATG
ncbi:MAG: CBS domain-containing protein [Pseudomonadota bacterium]